MRLRRFESFPLHQLVWMESGRLCAGVAQLVEHQPSKLRVAGPNPVSRSILAKRFERCCEGPRGSVVEHFLGKEGVTGSIPVVGSMLVVA